MTSKTKAQAPAIEIITDLKALGAAIKANAKAHQKVDSQWQVLALSAIAAFEQHGNVFYINDVFKSLGKGSRHKAMVLYFITYGGVKANTGESKDQTPLIKDSDKHVDLEGARSTMWYDMAPSPAPDEVVDYYALIMKAVKKSPKEGQKTEHADFREAVAKLAAEYATKLEGASADEGVLSGVTKG